MINDPRLICISYNRTMEFIITKQLFSLRDVPPSTPLLNLEWKSLIFPYLCLVLAMSHMKQDLSLSVLTGMLDKHLHKYCYHTLQDCNHVIQRFHMLVTDYYLWSVL